MPETSGRPGVRRAAFVAATVVAVTLVAPLAGVARDEVTVESSAAAFRASAGVAPAPVDAAVLPLGVTVPANAPVVSSAVRTAAVASSSTTTTTLAVPVRAEVAPSFVNDVLGLLGRTVGVLLNALGGAVRTAPASPSFSSSTSTSTSTSTTLACRNSTNPACGPFRFDRQPAPDRQMTVQVVAQPATVAVGQPVVFRLTLVDPDGVSHRATTFLFGGDAGQGTSSIKPCEKYGP